ncbi:MAG: 3-methyl-2-oxobutanoate hydroxymethyltransferase [Rhodospirillales bacterium]|nr:3-methyl-2-oxobutanoate hydroxymethyltransferase [Rhodospirillales bacterium]
MPDSPVRRPTTTDIRAAKDVREPLACLTCYTAQMARAIDEHVDLILVGDSLGMTIYGFDTTLPVTLDMMVAHGQAVVRSTRSTFVVVDLPFGSYEASEEQAFRSSSRILAETGAQAVKLEGGVEVAQTVRFLVDRGIPVMAHVGLMPQRIQALGGFRAQGRTPETALAVIRDAEAVSAAGAFAVVVEAVPVDTGKRVTEAVPIPTIGIGAGPHCDGQILVIHDALGLFPAFTPRFVKRYAELGAAMSDAAAQYAAEVRSRTFPAPEHTFKAAGGVANPAPRDP